MTIDLRKPHHHTPGAHSAVRDVPGANTDSLRDIRRTSKRKQERAVMVFAAAVIVLIVLVLAVFGISKAWGYFFGGSEYEVRSLVSNVGKHMLVPEDETPTLATVTDMHALEGQEFFKNAEEGDKVLMYMRSQKAILYRPSIDKIIEVGPITGSAE